MMTMPHDPLHPETAVVVINGDEQEDDDTIISTLSQQDPAVEACIDCTSQNNSRVLECCSPLEMAGVSRDDEESITEEEMIINEDNYRICWDQHGVFDSPEEEDSRGLLVKSKIDAKLLLEILNQI